jgi:hypothetical protein
MKHDHPYHFRVTPRTTPRLRHAILRRLMQRGPGRVEVCALTLEALIAESFERERLHALLNTPELADFAKAVVREAAHQRERWGAKHDAGKTPWDWFWLIGYLAQKAGDAAIRGDNAKALHHTISTAAALANWHARILGAHTAMRPGIAPPDEEAHP